MDNEVKKTIGRKPSKILSDDDLKKQQKKHQYYLNFKNKHPFYYKKPFLQYKYQNKPFPLKRTRLLRKQKRPCQEHSGDELSIWVKKSFSKKARIQLLNSHEWSQ